MIVHVVATRSFDPLDLEVEVFHHSVDAEAWGDHLVQDGVEEENIFIFTCEVRDNGSDDGRLSDDQATVGIVLPADLLAAVDDAAQTFQLTRNVYILDALRERLGLRPNLIKRRRAVEILSDRLRMTGDWNAEEATRAARDSH